jgi:xanthine dehydrogenase YagS FAD-binding subunit
MREFAYERAQDVESAVTAVMERPDAAFLGGGTNLVDHMKLGVSGPGLLVDVSRLPLGGVEEQSDGRVRIGAAVRNSELAGDPLIRARYPMLARALLAGASPQLRNLATTAGNLLQRTRCVYFQDVTTPCNKREPGSGCSALNGYTRHHAVLGASDQCVAVHPSDMAVALTALDAVIEIRGADGGREVPIGDLYRLPGDQPELDTTLEHGELITAVILPELPMARSSTYRKVRDRASYAFALVSVAAAVELEDGLISNTRIAFGGLAHKPWRAEQAERSLIGTAPSDEAYGRAAEAELAAAVPLRDNGFKAVMARNVLVSVLRELTTGELAR